MRVNIFLRTQRLIKTNSEFFAYSVAICHTVKVHIDTRSTVTQPLNALFLCEAGKYYPSVFL